MVDIMAKKKKKNNNKLVLISVIITILLVSSSVLSYQVFINKEEKEEEIVAVEEFILDDRISPLENQGLILEVLRIRHRGLHDRLMEFGNSWKKTPTFYFKSNIDGLEYSSKEESPLTTWDSIFFEQKNMRDVEEEQEESVVSLTLFEIVKKGLIFKRTNDVEKDSFTVTYDYRTGRWTGDDYLNDADGLGHYVGETFEIWFNIYPTDIDGDGIPYWTEVNLLDTDPWYDDSKLDPDDDGIPTTWEWKYGYNPNEWDDHRRLDPDVDGIENIEEFKLAKWFSDPFSPDIYIEVDGTVSRGLFEPEHVFYKESQQLLIERFCRHGINMYFDDGWPGGPVNGGGELIDKHISGEQDAGVLLQFYNNHFADERKGIFRYMVVGCESHAFNHPAKYNRYDAVHIYTDNILFFAMRAWSKRTQRIYLATQAQHELGHSMGISPWTHEGCDNNSYLEGKQQKREFEEKWGNYYSLMNYYYLNQDSGNLLFDITDYSDGSHGEGDHNDWEKLYLPAFQTEARVIEEVLFEPPCVDKIVDEELKLELKNWEYNEELTKQFSQSIGDWSPLDPIKIEWFVLEKTDKDDTEVEKDIRVYAMPDVFPTIPSWTLSYEGKINSEGNIQFFSFDEIIKEITK